MELALARQYGVLDFTERVVKDVRLPRGIASDEDFYRQEEQVLLPNLSFLRLHFYYEGRLSEMQVLFLLRRVTDVFKNERNVLRLNGPITICGDIHGQYFDLVNFMTSAFGGNPMLSDYLFLGDYVDRGYFSVECLLWLFSLKIARPKGIFLLRGNHESKHMTNYFSFRIECTRKYSERIYDAFIEVFKTMPLAAIVDDKLFCVHGGIGPDIQTIQDIEKIYRFVEIPVKGPMCDLLWSDPAPPGIEGLPGNPPFVPNTVRGCSYYYSYDAVCKFLRNNQLATIVRAHEAQEGGYSILDQTQAGYPSVITLFSAPNYCDLYLNKGAIMNWSGEKMTFKWFWQCSHPFWLPNLSDAFSWSLPFIAEKALDVLQTILDVLKEDGGSSGSSTPPEKKLVMSHVYGLIRESGPEGATEFRTLPVEISDTLGSAENEARRSMLGFEDARSSDIMNERLPPILVAAGEAKEFYAGKGVYALRKSKDQAARKTSVGTTVSSSPSTRRRGAEVTLALMRHAANLLEKDGKQAETVDLDDELSPPIPHPSGRLRGKVRVTTGPTSAVLTNREDNEKRLMVVIKRLRMLQLGAATAKEMADVIQFVEDEEE